MRSDQLRSEITKKVIGLMEANGGDWIKPWVGTHGLPINVVTENEYHGINVLILLMAQKTTPIWGTYKQWLEKGEIVNKGEKGTHVIFYKIFDKDNGESFPVMRNYTIFNKDQIKGFKEESVREETLMLHDEAFNDQLVRSGAVIKHGGDSAFYRRDSDEITMPHYKDFRATKAMTMEENYYATLLHELTHWTAHESRLDREKKQGREAYAFEELIAELGSAFMMCEYGMTPEPREDHAKYMNAWIEILRMDENIIFKAASKASKATEYINQFR
jgi:antirestriction protein ArdC